MTSWDTLPLNVLWCISRDCQRYVRFWDILPLCARMYIPGLSKLHDIMGYPAIKCARVYVPGLSELQDILGYPAIKCVRVYIPELSELNDMTLSGCGTEHCTTGQDSSTPPCKTSVNRSSSTEGYALSVGEDWKMTAYAETCCLVWSNTCLSPCRITWGWSD